jgi:hypothetical protein
VLLFKSLPRTKHSSRRNECSTSIRTPWESRLFRLKHRHVPGRRPRRLRAAVGSSGRRAHDAAITVAQMRNVLGRVKVYTGMTGRIPPSLRRQGGTACSFRRRRSSTALLGRPRQSEADQDARRKASRSFRRAARQMPFLELDGVARMSIARSDALRRGDVAAPCVAMTCGPGFRSSRESLQP